MTVLPYSEQQENEARRAHLETKLESRNIGWSYDPADLRAEVDTIAHSFSTGVLGKAEAFGAMMSVALRAIKMLQRASDAELHDEVRERLGDHQYSHE